MMCFNAAGTALGDDLTSFTETDEFRRTLFDCLMQSNQYYTHCNLLTVPENACTRPITTLYNHYFLHTKELADKVSQRPQVARLGGA